MNRSLGTSLTLLSLPVFLLLLLACGGTTSTSGSTGSGGSGGSTTTSTTGSGGSGGSTTTATTGAGGAGPMNACTNAADQAIAMSKDLAAIVGKCGQDNLGQEPATYDCIKMMTGLSDDCVTCFDGTVQCVVMSCFSECIADPGSQACTDCRAMHCDPVFEACSGLPSSN